MYRLLGANRAVAVQKALRVPPTAHTTTTVCCGGGNAPSNFIHYQQYYQMLYRQTPAATITAATTTTIRTQTTTPTQADALAQAKKKRLRKPRYAKYVELLEVTEQAISERRSRVKRLKSKKLADFIQKAQQQILERRARADRKDKKTKGILDLMQRQPVEYQKVDMEALNCSVLESGIYDDRPLLFFGKDEYTKQVISNPEEVQNILKSFHNFRDIIESMGNDQHEVDFGLTSPKVLAEDSEVLDPFEAIEPYINPLEKSKPAVTAVSMPNASAVTTKSKKRFKSKIHVNEEQERLAKQRALHMNLNTYLHVCVSANMLSRALSTIIAYRGRVKKSTLPHMNEDLITIDLYNILLHGYAGKGSFDRSQELFKLIEEDGLTFNEQSYAAIFECLGRLESDEQNQQLISKYIAQAEEEGFSLNRIMDRSKFVADQRDIALDAIRRIRPKFKPVYVPPQLGYDNVLLDHLNEHVLPVGAEKSPGKKDLDYAIMNSKRGYTTAQLEQLAREQLKIELDGSITIKSIEKSKEFANSEKCRERLKELEETWRKQISSAIVRDLNTLRAQVRFKPHGFMNYYTYLKTLDTSHFADILIKELYKLAEGSETFSPTVGQLYKELGQKVQQRYQIEQKKHNGTLEKIGEIYSSYCDLWDSGKSQDNTRQAWQRLVHDQRESGPSMDLPEVPWPSTVLTGVGRFLYNILMRDIKIDAHVMRLKSKTKAASQPQNLLPAFYTLFRNQGRFVKEEVKPHPVLSRLFRASRQQTLTFDSNLVPMLCPPQPWSTPHNGGYLLNKSELIRLPHQAIQQWDRINASNPQHLYPALDSLNQLASVPWRVNTQLLDVIIEVFQNGGDAKLDVPQPPSSLPPLPTLPTKDVDGNATSNADRAKEFRDKLGHRRKQAEMYSLWCDALYRLSLAQHYRDKVFWLPHNMDFRGRVYPVPPHLNHLGSDLARSMLIFDQAQPLGVDGFSWLKLHCINLTGLKKRDSVRERLLYAEEIMPDILDSADNPLKGRMWWAKSDEPWQTLACCMEIANVHRCPDPAAYLSRFPIHQDGSCNGLQHYAALGRDEAGACSVNLAPSAVPQDVYSAVATLVERSRKTDAQNGLHVAEALAGFVRRKVIKQTVMTTVYGVTRYGARLQIARQLKDIDEFPKDWVWPASTYLTTKTFESLREMFTSTREIQDWFTECARLISGVCSQNVEWVTPLGLPVVQPYNRQEMKHSPRTGFKVTANQPMDMYERPNILKQKNAFPPNFIHSLDSSHMMLTSLHCERQGITFVSVHDCFWTHANAVPDLNRMCREQFVALHSQPILEQLSEFMRQTYSYQDSDFTNDGSVEDLSKRQLNRTLKQLPQKGDFDLRNVLDSVYFFS
ncbi:LOW QUALITY PROTEIN: DNA-directed RNA polymerase, mitochondrial [Drosophila eugracilis]|uniref:LOW QUALITY PROTEIN: DNA-directed RNA polymerase, mitochondrial n=1 Tax=Drosophila eugracilis TaxID=29029 RepID=UPI001BDA830D|nr:LOW QUALITY PROTEIN: DNA-directed RNA polymerase, mitochondrial [Drosophila eugracilis]